MACMAREDLPGRRLQVPFGQKTRVGIIVDTAIDSQYPSDQLKQAIGLLPGNTHLPVDILSLCKFVSDYYQAAIGQILMAVLPQGLKRISPTKRRAVAAKSAPASSAWPQLTDDQQAALQVFNITNGFAPYLLFGVTGSGKTELYMHLIERTLQSDGQSLLLVPEINLTPQLEAQLLSRFPGERMAILHSELGEAARERNWLAAANGEASVVLGTRLAVFTPMPRLQLIVVDEEHDPSFKQFDGARYSARDVAVMRARERNIPIVLGSATPALESWANAKARRYQQVDLPRRAILNASLPKIRIIDIRRVNLNEGLSEPLLVAIEKRLQSGEQSLLFLNRRGYAPVLSCAACDWVSYCQRCSSTLVVHLVGRRLRCHHCGFDTPIQRSCPECGNQDIVALGRGTQRLEDALDSIFPKAHILRVDRDSVKNRKQWSELLDKIRLGGADILVGTQMLAKGHNFPRLTLVGVVGADAALHAADFRATERLFAQLMQVAGRAGRADLEGEVMVQTRYPSHTLFDALVEHDYPRYAQSLLRERLSASLPPYSSQAILRAESMQLSDSLAFLQQSARLPAVREHPNVTLYDPVPMQLTRVANFERGQILIESASRVALQSFLPCWREQIEQLRIPRRLRWHIEVDPVYY